MFSLNVYNTFYLNYKLKEKLSYMNKVLAYNIRANQTHPTPYQYLFLKGIRLCCCTDVFCMYSEGDIKTHRKEMDMTHYTGDHDIQ